MHARFSRKPPAGTMAATSAADTTAALPAAQESPRRHPSKLRLVLAGIGAFLVAIALLLLFFIGPQVIAAPVSFNQTDILKATNASYFNAGTLTTELGANLTYTLTIRSDPSASSHTNAVWNSSAVLEDPLNHAQINVVVQRAAFNRRTGQLLNCCGASLNNDTRVRQTGIGLFWPIGTHAATYQVFDPNSGHAFPARYVGTARVEGLTAYQFVQHVPPTVAAQMAGIPSYLLGLHGSGPSVVVADRYWQADNTFWVDARTGVLVNEEVKGLSVLRGPGGQGRLVVAKMDLTMTPSTQHQLVALANKNASSITMLRVVGPISTGILGVLLIAAAFVPFRRRPSRAVPEGPEAHEGLEMVTDSMRAADDGKSAGKDAGPADGVVTHESQDASKNAGAANGTVSRESREAAPANGAKPPASEDASKNAGPANGAKAAETEEASKNAGPAGTATTRESEDGQA